MEQWQKKPHQETTRILELCRALALPDFGKEGNLLGFVAGVPPGPVAMILELLVEIMTPLSI